MALSVFSLLPTVLHVLNAKILLYFFFLFTLFYSVFPQFLVIIFPLKLSAKMKHYKIFTQLKK